jgi:SAM-dependent methyltransferase
MPQKWEHERAIEDLQECHTILEVGCGRGDFVDRLNRTYNKNASGIEFNPEAVARAKKQAIPVSSINIHELAGQDPESFDAVCTFQVLEHITDIYEFLDSLIKLVKSGGKLIISVPNSDSFIQYDPQDILNKPPHHMSQWYFETFNYLTGLFPIKIKNIAFEPLREYHIDWYVNTMKSCDLSKSQNRGARLRIKIYYKALNLLLKKLPLLCKNIKGHTLYICFQKS